MKQYSKMNVINKNQWEIKKLKHFAKIETGATPSSSVLEFWDGDINWFTPSDISKINSVYIEDSERKITKKGYESCGVSLFPPNSIIITTRAPIGNIAINKKEGCTNQGCKTVRVLEGDTLYYYYLLLTNVEELNSLGQGTTFTELSSYNLKNIKLHYPPITEQIKISKYLNIQTEKIESLIEQKRQMINLLKEERAGIINYDVLMGTNLKVKTKPSNIKWLGDIPENWKIKKLKYVVNVQLSNVDKKTEEGEESVSLCNYIDVYKNEFITSKIDFMISTAKPEEIKKFKIKRGDVMITKDSETPEDIAIPALVKDDFDNVVCGYHLSHLRPDEKIILGDYLHRIFQTRKFNDRMVISANGVTRFGIGLGDISNLQILIPPIPEQEQIVKHIESETSKIDKTLLKIESEIALLQEYKTALISEAVTGKIDVRGEM